MKNIAKILRKDTTNHSELSHALNNYEKLVMDLSFIDMDSETNKQNIHLESGEALGTTWAAMCIRDMARTKAFVCGLFKAIERVIKLKNGPVKILYAGTGPFATLALPIMASSTEKDVQFTLMEINQTSLNNAKSVIEGLNFSKYVSKYLKADASNYVLDPNETFDIVISETMQRALEKEQQVHIVTNVLKQLDQNTILIPERIKLDLCLLNFNKHFIGLPPIKESEYCIRLGSFFELDSSFVSHFYKNKTEELVDFPFKHYQITSEQIIKCSYLAVLTDIQVFENIHIEINESGLTMPLILEKFSCDPKNYLVSIRYKLDKIPGIVYKISHL